MPTPFTQRALTLCALLTACAPELKPGTDRADAGTPTPDVGTTDAPVVDVPSPDAPAADVPPPTDAGPDAGPPSTAQRSCPDPRERGCGMVEVRGGAFTMGVSDPSTAASLDGFPAQPNISVRDFAIDAHEVTVARFRRFWAVASTLTRVTAVPYPAGPLPLAVAPRAPDPTSTSSPECNWTDTPGAREQHPINCIDWYTAQAFCVWDGGRLPTDAEWEYTARGRTDGGLLAQRSFPWGEEAPGLGCERARWRFHQCPGEDGAQTRRVGSFTPTPDLPGSRVYDLAGNIYEWTADNYTPYDDPDRHGCWGARPEGRADPLCAFNPMGPRTIRGGSWYFDAANVLRGASRFAAELDGPLVLIGVGMRCARSRP